MTDRERVFAALEGRIADRTPVTVPYSHLYHEDHFGELTGRPDWHRDVWMHSEPAEYARVFEEVHEQAPFALVQPARTPSPEERESVEFVEKDGEGWRHDRRNDSWERLATVSGHARDYILNETQHVFTMEDAKKLPKPVPASVLAESGAQDYVRAVAARMGKEHFILSGGLTGTIFPTHWHLGQTNLLVLMVEQPDLVAYLAERALEENIEEIRALAAGGGDAIFIDESLATSDMISPKMYEKFGLPGTRAMVEEIRRLKHKAIIYYFGGVADRLDLIAATGADAILVETSMKGYVNDIVEIAGKIGKHFCLLGNLDPVSVLEKGKDADLEKELKRQARVKELARGYIAATGSPITPGTSLDRVRKFIELGAKY